MNNRKQLASCNNMQKNMLKATQNKGFSLTFENNLTISVQFGYANYCENRNYGRIDSVMQSDDVRECINAEIAIWDEENNWFNFGSDTVKGYVDANEVARWINKVANATNLNSLESATYEG